MIKNNININFKCPEINDFEDNIVIDEINTSDYNIICSRIYNRCFYNWIDKSTSIPGFNKYSYKISSQIPVIQDTMSYLIMKKTYDFTYSKKKAIDTMDLMLIRQNIDKKQRYYMVNNKILKYGKYTTSPRRFVI